MLVGEVGSKRVLQRIEGETAYVCPKARYQEAIDDPGLAIGFPLEDVRFTDAG